MKKINIIDNDNSKDEIEGYNNLPVEQIGSLSNGTCSEIICTILDKSKYDNRINTIINLYKKLSNLGFLTLKFINGTKLCKDVMKGNSNSRFISSIVSQSESIFLESDIIEIISQIEGAKIHKTYNDNYYSIVVIQKKL